MQFRPDAPRPSEAGKPVKYAWPAGTELPIWVHPDMKAQVASASLPLLIVEGTKQYLAVVSHLDGAYAAVGMSGCWGWQRDDAPCPDLAALAATVKGREIILCFDADRHSNYNVWRAAKRLRDVLTTVYLAEEVRFADPPASGTDGLDDVLARSPEPGASLAKICREARKDLGRQPKIAPGDDGSRTDDGPQDGPATVPAGPPPDGAALLDETVAALARFIVFARPEHLVAAALYAAATHAVRELQFAPRLRVKSPVKRCGKTLLLDVLSCLVHRPLPTANASTAALVRSIGADPATLVLDEMDAVFGRTVKGDEKAETLRGVLNAGFGRGKPYLRYDVNTGQVESFPTFALAIIAGIGDLPDTIEDRAVIVPLARKTDGATVARFRLRRDPPWLCDLGARLAAWIGPLAAAIGAAEPAMPPGMSDRAEDTWEPLIAVADAAGGHWPALAREAARVMAAAAAAADADADVKTRLLADLRTVLGDAHALHTGTILERLAGLSGAPWSDWRAGRALNDRQLAEMLRPFGARSRDVKLDGVNRKGYYAADLWDAWQRYGAAAPGGSATSATSATPQVSAGAQVALAENERYQRYPDPPPQVALVAHENGERYPGTVPDLGGSAGSAGSAQPGAVAPVVLIRPGLAAATPPGYPVPAGPSADQLALIARLQAQKEARERGDG